MSYTFSRRAFFRYSAAAAVAVAGMGLLGGCSSTGDPNNPYSILLDTAITNIYVTAILHKENTDVEHGVFTVTVQNARTNPLILSPANFSVSVFRPEDKTNDKGELVEENAGKYYSLNKGGVKISGLTDDRLEKGASATFKVTATDFPEIEKDDIVVFKYIPVTTSMYAGYSMSWRITKQADDYTDINQPSDDNTDSNS